MSKLQPLENTVVHLKTQAEYDEYMQLAEEAGWVWSVSNRQPTQAIGATWSQYGTETCVTVKERLSYGSESWHSKVGYNITTLPALKFKFGIGTKAPKLQPEPWQARYTKSGHTLSADKIKLASGKEYTPAELQAELNLLRSIQKAHKKYFPSAK